MTISINYFIIEKSRKENELIVFVTRYETSINGVNVPRFDIEQADVTPLMSALIGTGVPANNVGKIPKHYMNVSKVPLNVFLFLPSHFLKLL